MVTDKLGKSIAGLTRDDFTIKEDGDVQPISIFEVNDSRGAAVALEDARSSESAGSLFFSNLVPITGGATNVILLDRLNAACDSQWYARRHLDSYLQKMRPGDRAAVYVLDGSLRVLHDFSADHQSLRRALESYSARTTRQYDASNEPPAANPEGGIAVWLVDPTGNMAEFFTERRAFDTFAAFTAIAKHLAGIPGRKSVVWLSEAFAIPMRDGRGEFLDRMRRAVHALSDAQVALYPVDARGLVGAIRTGRDGRPAFTTFAGVRGNIETMQVVADETGGRAFFNNNALDVSVHRAVEDSRLTYLLGYYPSDTKWDGKYRAISVKVNRPGVVVRHRKGFYARTTASDSSARESALRQALEAPLQSTRIGMFATAERQSDGSVKVAVRLTPETLALDRAAGTWTGKVDMLFADVSRRGVGKVVSTAKLDVTLTDEGRDKATREGLLVERTLTLRPDAFQLRIVARDVVSGYLGSLVIPAAQLR